MVPSVANINLGAIENSYYPTANLISISGRALQALTCILITTWSDSPEENVLTLCRVSWILLLLISRGKGTPLYGLYRDVLLHKVLYVQRQYFNSPVESTKQQTDPYGGGTKK